MNNINNYLTLERKYRMIARSINNWAKYPEEQELLQQLRKAYNNLTDDEIHYLNESLP